MTERPSRRQKGITCGFTCAEKPNREGNVQVRRDPVVQTHRPGSLPSTSAPKCRIGNFSPGMITDRESWENPRSVLSRLPIWMYPAHRQG